MARSRERLGSALMVLVIVAGSLHGLAAQTRPAQPKASAAARPAVVSQSTVTVSGPAAGGSRTIPLPYMNNFENKGDWYVTPSDAHAAFLLSDAQAFKEGRLDLTLNGKQTTFVITSENNKDTGRKTDQWFDLNLASGGRNTLFMIDKGDAVTITVTRMEPEVLEATFSGTLTQAGLLETGGREAYRVKVNGTISLHRASAPAAVSAGSYADCDPIIHDWLNQAEDRAPSDCEVKFDHETRSSLIRAFEPTLSAFGSQQWQVTQRMTSDSVTARPRGSEKAPYQLAGTFRLAMAASAPDFQRLKAAADVPDPGLAKVLELMQQGKYAEAQAADQARTPSHALADFSDNTQIEAVLSINQTSKAFVNFHGTYAASPLAGGGTVLYLPDQQPATGGSSGEEMTYVLLGPWSQPTATRPDAESSHVSIKAATTPTAPRLSVQTIVVSFRCSRDLAQKAIQTVNWSALRGLIGH